MAQLGSTQLGDPSDVAIKDVEALAKNGWTNLPDTKKEAMLDIAQSQATNLYGEGKVSTLPTLIGDAEDFTKFLTAHLWEMSEGGEAQSESAGGGNITYNTVTGEVFNNLSETRYGRQALEYLRDEQSIGVITTF